MRITGLFEVIEGSEFAVEHIPGVKDRKADGISRWNRRDIQANLTALRLDVPWQELPLTALGTDISFGVLTSDSKDQFLHSSLNERLMSISSHEVSSGCG